MDIAAEVAVIIFLKNKNIFHEIWRNEIFNFV